MLIFMMLCLPLNLLLACFGF
jgi:hypothetical protein